jgi:DNA-binding XRE family transcriptional regulator
MKRAKRERLEAAGWKVGGAEEFLSLSEAEGALIDIRIALANTLRKERTARRISQSTLAARIGSSQSRVAKMEAGDPSVSLDLLVRTLLSSGSSGATIAAAFKAAAVTPKAKGPSIRR